MFSQHLRGVRDLSPASWIAPCLTGRPGTVTGTVPAGYPAYARICHPAEAGDRLATWAEVAAETGGRVHPTMQWHALVGSSDPLNAEGSLWRGGNPRRGQLVPEVLGPLCNVLADHTGTAETCWFCIWEGYGWIHGSPQVGILGSDEHIPPAFDPEYLEGPRVSHPGRDYLLCTGALPDALSIGRQYAPDWFQSQPFNLWWPADRAWCVASEIDFDSTLVGGSPALIDTLLRSPQFDAWPIQPDDSLRADADQINVSG